MKKTNNIISLADYRFKKSVRTINLLLIVTCSLLCLTISSCVEEDLSECQTAIAVMLEAENSVDEESIHDVTLYAFGSDGKLLESRQTVQGKKEIFLCPFNRDITFTGWCNTANTEVAVSPLSPQKSLLSEGFVSLVEKAVAHPVLTGVYSASSDLFWGTSKTHPITRNEDIVIRANRKVASMNVTVRKLREHTDIYDNNYSIVIRTKNNKIDFAGQCMSDNVIFVPTASFQSNGEMIAPTFNLLPSLGETLIVQLYHDDTVIYEASTNPDGTPFQAVANQTLNILISFNQCGGVVMTVVNSGWGEVYQWEKVIG